MVEDTNIPKINECLSRSSTPGMAIHHYSQSGVYSFHECNWFDRSLVFLRCLQINFDDRIPCNGFPRARLRVLNLVRVPCNGFPRAGNDGFSPHHQTQPMTVSSETPGACRCSRTWRCWRPCHASRYQIHHRFWFGGNSFFTTHLLHPFGHRLRAAWRAEHADVQQREKEKIIPFITCEIPFGQKVCELVFGVDIFDFDLGVQSRATRTTSQEQLCGFSIHVSLLDFSFWQSSLLQPRCLQRCTT